MPERQRTPYKARRDRPQAANHAEEAALTAAMGREGRGRGAKGEHERDSKKKRMSGTGKAQAIMSDCRRAGHAEEHPRG